VTCNVETFQRDGEWEVARIDLSIFSAVERSGLVPQKTGSAQPSKSWGKSTRRSKKNASIAFFRFGQMTS